MSWKTPFIRASAKVVSRKYGIVRQLLREPVVLDRLCADTRLLAELFGRRGALRPVLEDPALREVIGLDPAAVLQGISPEDFQTLMAQAEKLGLIAVADLVTRWGLDAVCAQLPLKAVVDHYGLEALCEAVPLERLIAQFGIDATLESLPPERIIEHLGVERVCEILGAAPIVRELGLEALLDALVKAHSLKTVMNDKVAPRVANHDDTAALLATFLDRADPDGRHLASYLAERPEAVRTIARNDGALRNFLIDPDTRNRLRVLDGAERAAGLGYALPAVVVSYPRSGSNFLQSILSHSSGMQNISIYADKPWTFVPLLTVKSHALSPDYLADEWQRLLKRDDGPERILLIKRDPRDVMISFYEYTQVQRKASISQEEFLEHIDFFYASTIDKTYSRRVDMGPVSVVQAYKKHVAEWFAHRPASLKVQEFAYEDLVLQPRERFREALDFLGLSLPVAESYLQVKVSQYSEESRPRAVVHSWQATQEHYATLLEGIERLLGDEIALLGYERSETAAAAPPPEV